MILLKPTEIYSKHERFRRTWTASDIMHLAENVVETSGNEQHCFIANVKEHFPNIFASIRNNLPHQFPANTTVEKMARIAKMRKDGVYLGPVEKTGLKKRDMTQYRLKLAMAIRKRIRSNMYGVNKPSKVAVAHAVSSFPPCTQTSTEVVRPVDCSVEERQFPILYAIVNSDTRKLPVYYPLSNIHPDAKRLFRNTSEAAKYPVKINNEKVYLTTEQYRIMKPTSKFPDTDEISYRRKLCRRIKNIIKHPQLEKNVQEKVSDYLFNQYVHHGEQALPSKIEVKVKEPSKSYYEHLELVLSASAKKLKS